MNIVSSRQRLKKMVKIAFVEEPLEASVPTLHLVYGRLGLVLKSSQIHPITLKPYIKYTF